MIRLGDQTPGNLLGRLAKFMGNPAGAAIVGAVGLLRKSVQGGGSAPKRFLVIAPIVDDKPGTAIQVQQ